MLKKGWIGQGCRRPSGHAGESGVGHGGKHAPEAEEEGPFVPEDDPAAARNGPE